MFLKKIVLFAFFALLSESSFATNADLDLIMQNIRQWSVVSPKDSIVKVYMDEMREDGSYADINYEDKANTWQPQAHYNRLKTMSYAYISPQNVYYNNAELYKRIVKGIQYWLALNPKSTNWYHNEIDEPTFFGLILIAMRDGEQKLSDELEHQIFERWCKNGSNPAKRTGSNRSEMAVHWMYFGCLMEAVDTLDLALNYIFEPVAYTNEEGLQVDNSFLQHGPQLYIGGYGEVMLESVLKTAVCVKGTQYTLPDDKLKILRDYVLTSYSIVIRGEVMHWNAIGRQLSRPDFLRYPERRIPIFEMMKEVDEQYAQSYNQILDRLKGTATPDEGVLPYHAQFYRGDYALHSIPGYSFATRMVSSRTCRQESINGENLLGYYLSDGSTVITRSGKEYLDIMPLWDWNKIPGVTAPLLETIPEVPAMSTYGTTEFAGGVSDSIYGCSGYQYYDGYSGVNTGATKGYFFFDDEVVCLGTGINSDHEEVQTTVNQCWGKNSFTIGTQSGEIEEKEGEIASLDISNCNWLIHDGIGYYFPKSQKVKVENRERIGNWRWISTMWASKELTGKVFTLGIEHQVPVKDRTYSYVIIPNSTTKSLSNYIKKADVEILTNTDSVQIVYHKEKRIYECIFYRACTYKGDVEITSLQPCAMLIKQNEGVYNLHISDPTQSKNQIIIGVKDKGMEEMCYGSCDYSGIDTQFAGMTKQIKIIGKPTSIYRVNTYPTISYSEINRTLRFDNRYKGHYTLMGMNGVVVSSDTFDSEMVTFDTNIHGFYILSVDLGGSRPIIRKIIIK